ncbi:MAG: fluoride efflux transporter CrcB [Ignavibacteriaceae bacterium]|jgi:fluoride exporter
MLNYIYIGIGSAIGGMLRFWLSNSTYRVLPVNFPYGTLIVNVIGSFILGMIVFYFNEKELLNAQLRIFLSVGFCGGFTTFSTFSLETMSLFRDAQYLYGFVNVFFNLVLCFLGIYIAFLISKLIG